MHTVDLLERALTLAEQLGYEIRQEWLGGGGGGGCELHGRKVFFLDLALSPLEQLDDAINTLCREPAASALPLPAELHQLLKTRQAA